MRPRRQAKKPNKNSEETIAEGKLKGQYLKPLTERDNTKTNNNQKS